MEVNDAKQLFGSNRSSKYLPLCSAEDVALKEWHFCKENLKATLF